MILYFSGTGNCKYVAHQVAKDLCDQAKSIENADTTITLSAGECFGIVTPTHRWKLPVIVRDYLTKIEVKSDCAFYSFLIATYGTTPGCCEEEARRIFENRKHTKTHGQYHHP